MSTDARTLLDLLIEHELALKRLYEAFAAVFVDSGAFWRRLAGDEQSHADQLDRLRAEPRLHQWLALEGQVKAQAVVSSLEYVQMQSARVQGGGVGRLQALAIAHDLENSLIERQFLVPGGSVCGDISEALAVLKAETERHRQVIADALETEKRLGT